MKRGEDKEDRKRRKKRGREKRERKGKEIERKVEESTSNCDKEKRDDVKRKTKDRIGEK
jgi:hypothetical protein